MGFFLALALVALAAGLGYLSGNFVIARRCQHCRDTGVKVTYIEREDQPVTKVFTRPCPDGCPATREGRDLAKMDGRSWRHDTGEEVAE